MLYAKLFTYDGQPVLAALPLGAGGLPVFDRFVESWREARNMEPATVSLTARADDLMRTRVGITLQEDELANLLQRVALYAGTRKLLADPTIANTVSAPSRRLLNELFVRHPILFMLGQIFDANDDKSDKTSNQDAEEILVRVARLNVDDAVKISSIVHTLKEILNTTAISDDWVDCDEPFSIDPPERLVARILDNSSLDSFFDDKQALLHVIEPARLLLNISAFEAQPTTVATPAQPVMRRLFAAMFDDLRYAAAAAAFDSLGHTALADTARIMGAAAGLLNNIFDGKLPTFAEITEIDRLLRVHDARADASLEILGPLRFIVLQMRMLLRRTVASSTGVARADRMRQLDLAQADLQQIGAVAAEFPIEQRPIFQLIMVQGPLLRWQQAMLESGDRREALRGKAMAMVNRMLADASLEQNVVARLSQMATLAAYPVMWKYELGDFKGSLEEATRAQAFAEGFAEALRREMAPMMEELDRANKSADPEERAYAEEFRGALLTSIRAAESMKEAHEIHIALSQAKIAEEAGNFGLASKFYDDASDSEKVTREAILTLLNVFVGNAAGRNVFASQASAHEAWSAYFEAMASLNRGDEQTIAGDFTAAQASYVVAKNSFLEAESLWGGGARGPHLASEPMAAARQLAARQEIICGCRARYCDARMGLAGAEKHAHLQNHRAAAKGFLSATTIFEEMLERSEQVDDLRNLDLLRGSAEFCKGRSLIELDLETSTDGNLASARAVLENAATLFERQREMRWARYVRALAAEGVAKVEYKVLLAGPHRQELGALVERSFADAAALFRQIDLLDRAAEMEKLSRGSVNFFALSHMLPPKPAELPPGADNASGLVDLPGLLAPAPSGVERKLRDLQARGIAVERSLDRLADMRSKGRIDEGRYLDLAKDHDLERIEILQGIQSLLGGWDAAFDGEVIAAIAGSGAVAIHALVEHGIKMINQHQALGNPR